MNKIKDRGLYISASGFILQLFSVFCYSRLPEYGCTDLYLQEPLYHFSITLSKISVILLGIGIIIYAKDIVWKSEEKERE